MDRGRRAEPYSNATIWTREIARNLAGHLSRVSKAQSCVDTRSPISTRLPQFHHSHAQKRCPTSPMKTRQPLLAIPRNSYLNGEQQSEVRCQGGGSAREETDAAISSNHNPEVDSEQYRDGKQELITRKNNGIPQLENRSTNAEVEANQDVSDRRVRIPAVKPPAKHHIGHVNGNVSEMTTYDTPLHQGHRVAHDYYKRQEQQKIWQENQALIKRLQSTKATLNFKQWEKDGKWAQEFLKTQERRRSALQHELRKAQVSPHAVLRSKPLKSLHPYQLKNIHHEGSDKKFDLVCSPTKADVTAALSSRNSSRRGSKGQSALVTQKSAANHRRIMELRKQKPAPPNSNNAAGATTTDPTTGDVLDSTISDAAAAFIPDNDIVTVRFTFSRGRSRCMDKSTSEIEQTKLIAPLEVDPGDRDMMSLSGAFSPGVELEYALNAFAVNDADISQPQPDQTPENNVSTIDEIPVSAHNGVIGLSRDTAALENVDQHHQVDRVAKPTNPPIKPEVFPPPETEHMQLDEDEVYDGDNFDDEPLPSSRAPLELPDKHATSGCASEFEEEPRGDNHSNFTTAAPTNNQEESNEDEEDYSHDDFE